MSSQFCAAQSSTGDVPTAKAETSSKPVQKPAQKAAPQAKTETSGKSIKPIQDLDSFFKDAEQSTRDAYSKPDNCLPKLEDKSKPVS